MGWWPVVMIEPPPDQQWGLVYCEPRGGLGSCLGISRGQFALKGLADPAIFCSDFIHTLELWSNVHAIRFTQLTDDFYGLVPVLAVVWQRHELDRIIETDFGTD